MPDPMDLKSLLKIMVGISGPQQKLRRAKAANRLSMPMMTIKKTELSALIFIRVSCVLSTIVELLTCVLLSTTLQWLVLSPVTLSNILKLGSAKDDDYRRDAGVSSNGEPRKLLRFCSLQHMSSKNHSVQRALSICGVGKMVRVCQ